jgi:hypothetical protein|nr:MAG TPA: hypothetical protein [Caudoviricetes sp.]DAI34204.1 MAG TPA: hypothetical protein [Caudoviricetes sp.]
MKDEKGNSSMDFGYDIPDYEPNDEDNFNFE